MAVSLKITWETDKTSMASERDKSEKSEEESEEESEESDESDEELIFDGGKWKTYRVGSKKQREPFDTWLINNLPSKVHKKDGYAWISVCHETTYEDYPSDVDGLLDAWEQFLASGRTVNYESIKEMGCSFHVLSGKWLFFTDSGGKVDCLWSMVAKNIVSHELPCFTAKVSASEDYKKHVVCIYNHNFLDLNEVLMSEQAIRNMGIKCELMYKPDVYTWLGVYSKNPWKLLPIIMKSRFDLKTRKSLIEYFV